MSDASNYIDSTENMAQALAEAHDEIRRLTRERDTLKARVSDSTNCVVGLEADGGFPCRNCLPCLRRERDGLRAELEAERRDGPTRAEFETLRKAFRRYAEHDADCGGGIPDPKACECGLSVMLKNTELPGGAISAIEASDAARAALTALATTLKKERDEYGRAMAEAQREADAKAARAAVRHSQQTTDQCRDEVEAAVRSTPLVTDAEVKP